MTYSTDDRAEELDEERRGYAKYLGGFFIALTVIWLAGAAVLFTAAYKGSTMSDASAKMADGTAPASDASSAAPSGTNSPPPTP